MVLILYKGITVDSQNGGVLQLKTFGELWLKLSNTGSGENYDDAVLIIQTKRNMFIEICIAIHPLHCRTSIK
jgi:hypothetical protein